MRKSLTGEVVLENAQKSIHPPPYFVQYSPKMLLKFLSEHVII